LKVSLEEFLETCRATSLLAELDDDDDLPDADDDDNDKDANEDDDDDDDENYDEEGFEPATVMRFSHFPRRPQVLSGNGFSAVLK
jgi:hypothetical protein